MNIIPKPLKCTVRSGEIRIGRNSKVVSKSKLPLSDKYLSEFLNTLNLCDQAVAINLITKSELANEEYKIIINDNITIFCSSDIGALNAIKTLKQIGNTGIITCCEISDKPQYNWRGFMLDSARHFWTVDYIKKVLDVMASLKLNVLHWHLTDDQGWRMEIKKYPDLAVKGCKRANSQLYPNRSDHDNTEYGAGYYYTQEQIKNVISYAKNLGIDVMPEVDMPGHLVAAISVYPELSCEGKQIAVSNKWGILDTIGCCGSDKLYSFIDNILDEICTLFPFGYFHVGGDEAPKTKWKTCPKCQAKMKELGLSNEEDLQGYFNNYVAKYIKKYNKSLIGWNEILHADNLDKNAIVQWWTPGGKESCLKWINSGGKVILTKHQNFYFDHAYSCRPLNKTYGFNYKMLGIESGDGIIGIEAPQWTEYIKCIEKFEFNTYARMMALSDVAWTEPFDKNYAEFENRLEGLRGYYTNAYGIKIASQYFYRGKSVKCPILRTAVAWARWGKNPNFEFEMLQKGNNK